jgi:endonuclease/exonuclease/phosphatase family metal-dependent hydrolase
MSALITLIRDLIAFARQLIPSPIQLFRAYLFSPSDLALPRCGAAASAPLATFDVLSYNVNNAAAVSRDRRRRVIRAITSSGADVVLLQETNPAWEVHLLDDGTGIASQFVHRHFHHPGPDDRAAGGIAVLSRRPLESVRTLDFSDCVPGSVFPALTCAVEIPVRMPTSGGGRRPPDGIVAINIANVHLRPPVELDGTAWLGTARETEPIRISEARELMRRAASREARGTSLADPHPLHVIAGDFNEGDDAGALAHLASLGYVDALRRHVPRGKETHVWPFLGNRLLLRKRLDHILWRAGPLPIAENAGAVMECGARLQCVGCGVVTGFEDGASDHQPVLSRFVIVNE